MIVARTRNRRDEVDGDKPHHASLIYTITRSDKIIRLETESICMFTYLYLGISISNKRYYGTNIGGRDGEFAIYLRKEHRQNRRCGLEKLNGRQLSQLLIVKTGERAKDVDIWYLSDTSARFIFSPSLLSK